MTSRDSIVTASVPDTLKLLAEVVAPTLAKGPIIRRPAMVRLVERFDLDARAVRRVQALRERYGPVTLKTPIPGFNRALVISSDHVHEILQNTPEPFTTDSSEKHGALSHLQPRGSLISRRAERTVRREINELALQTNMPVHHHAARFVDIVNEEADTLLQWVGDRGELDYDTFFEAWFRVVRRVVFGDDARDDTELTDMSFQLRRDGNWAHFKPTKKALRERFLQRLQERIDTAAPDSLAGMFRDIPDAEAGDPNHQVPQWLFAYDPAGMTTFRSLAILASHPEAMARARQEVAGDESGGQYLPYLRATLLESLRLWPTTPLLLRQTTKETPLGGSTAGKDLGLLIFAPYFHRDETRLEFANRFAPEIWEGGKTASDLPLVPFSDGPGICPGRNVVLLTTTAFIARVISGHDLTLTSHHKDTMRPGALPATLDNFTTRFRLSPRA